MSADRFPDWVEEVQARRRLAAEAWDWDLATLLGELVGVIDYTEGVVYGHDAIYRAGLAHLLVDAALSVRRTAFNALSRWPDDGEGRTPVEVACARFALVDEALGLVLWRVAQRQLTPVSHVEKLRSAVALLAEWVDDLHDSAMVEAG